MSESARVSHTRFVHLRKKEKIGSGAILADLYLQQKNTDRFIYYLFSAYIIRIHKKTQLHFSECYNATITKLTWKHKWVKENIYNKLIPIDKYSPKVKRIHKKVFIVLSNCDQSQNLDFYLDRSRDKEDVVFKAARARKKFTEIFNWLWKKCRRKVDRSKSRIFY